MNIIWTEPTQFITSAKEKLADAEILLDIGCGIRPQNYIKPRVHICCDPNLKYINYLQKHYASFSDNLIRNNFKINPYCTLEDLPGTSYVFINAGWEEVLQLFPEKSVDSVFLMNVIEYLDKEKAQKLITETEKIARCQLVLFSSSSNGLNQVKEPWAFDEADFQNIKSKWTPEEFNVEWECIGCEKFDIYGSDGHLVDETKSSFYAIKSLSNYKTTGKSYNLKVDEYAETLSKLGEYVLSYDNDPDKAGKYFVHALELKPDYPEALNNLGAVAWMKEEKEKALDYFKKAYIQDTSNRVYVSNCVDTLLSFGKNPEAREMLSQYLEYYGNDDESKVSTQLET